jgi:hypothetical protein
MTFSADVSAPQHALPECDVRNYLLKVAGGSPAKRARVSGPYSTRELLFNRRQSFLKGIDPVSGSDHPAPHWYLFQKLIQVLKTQHEGFLSFTKFGGPGATRAFISRQSDCSTMRPGLSIDFVIHSMKKILSDSKKTSLNFCFVAVRNASGHGLYLLNYLTQLNGPLRGVKRGV